VSDHEVGDRFAKAEIAEVGGAFIGLEAGERGECVVVEQSRYLALAGSRRLGRAARNLRR